MDPSQQQAGIGQSLGSSLAQLQQLEAYKQQFGMQTPWTETKPTFPTVESIQKRIDAVKEQIRAADVLLKVLEDIHAVLVKHPDLERLVSAMARLGQL